MYLKIENIINYAIENGLEYEAFTNKFNRWGEEEEIQETYVGLELKPNVWYWWRCVTKTLNSEFEWVYDENYDLFFDKRYNCANGATQRSYRKGRDAEELILKNAA